MDVMPITKFNTMFDADHINSLFARQVSAITFFAMFTLPSDVPPDMLCAKAELAANAPTSAPTRIIRFIWPPYLQSAELNLRSIIQRMEQSRCRKR